VHDGGTGPIVAPPQRHAVFMNSIGDHARAGGSGGATDGRDVHVSRRRAALPAPRLHEPAWPGRSGNPAPVNPPALPSIRVLILSARSRTPPSPPLPDRAPRLIKHHQANINAINDSPRHKNKEGGPAIAEPPRYSSSICQVGDRALVESATAEERRHIVKEVLGVHGAAAVEVARRISREERAREREEVL